MERPTLESKEQLPPRNLRTHPEETIEAIALIEGPEWFERQSRIKEKDELDPGAYEEGSVAHALEKARKGMPAKILGKNGWNRWRVNSDGAVIFSSRSSEVTYEKRPPGDPELLQKIRDLGFEIVP